MHIARTSFAIILVSLTFVPYRTEAARFIVDTSAVEARVGDTVIVPILLDTEGETVNVVEGVLPLSLGAVGNIVELSTAGSALTLWPRTPSVSGTGTAITFTGGAPRGVVGTRVPLFSVVIAVNRVGSLTLGPAAGTGYLHDGRGTSIDLKGLSETLSVLPRPEAEPARDARAAKVAADRVPPAPFTVVQGRDDSLFDGRTFIAFSTVDADSGVAYYEVTEGDLPSVRADQTYVVQQPERTQRITVRAVDFAGNAREAVYYPGFSIAGLPFWIALVLIACYGLLFSRKRGAPKTP